MIGIEQENIVKKSKDPKKDLQNYLNLESRWGDGRYFEHHKSRDVALKSTWTGSPRRVKLDLLGVSKKVGKLDSCFAPIKARISYF